MSHGNSEFRYSLRFRLLGIIFLVWLIPTFVLSHFISTLFPTLHRMAENSLLSEAEYAWSQTGNRLDELISLSRNATYDGELASAWEQHRQGILGNAEFIRLSRNYLERKYSRESLILCSVYIPEGEADLLVFPRTDADRAAVYQKNAHAMLHAFRESTDTRCLFLAAGNQVYLVRNLLNTSLQPYGLLVLEVDYDQLVSSLSSVAREWEAVQSLRLDQIGEDSLDWDTLAPGLHSREGEELSYTRLSDSRDWNLSWHLSIRREKLFGQVNQFRRLCILMYLLLIPVLALIALYTYRRFSRPVSLLVQAAGRIEAGEFGTVVPMHGKDELGTLGRAFSAMSTRLKELIDRNYKEEIALRDARIQALQSRINPHFINNALEDINWQARMDGSEGVSRMVGALSILLNATMARRDRRTVTLREELSVVDAYLFFIQERFGDSLTWTREVDDSLLEAALPLLTLQPVLENAVEHGIAPAGGGTISIRISREESCMRIEIENTGQPLSPEDQARMKAALAENLEGNHVGLSNIASRLRLIYHGSARLEAASEENRTVIRMLIPIQTGEEIK